VTSLNDGALASVAGLGSTTYSYPQPTWVMGVVPMGPTGPDPARGVLTFTSAPLEYDIEIVGNGKLVVHASSTRDDMDFILKLSEQFAQDADERAKGVQPRYAIVSKGWLRGSHMTRDPALSTDDVPVYAHTGRTPLTPGKIYTFEIALEPIAYRFHRGNRIRLELCCGDSPVTDGLFWHLYRPDKIGADTIYHDAEHPSHLILPVLPVD